MNRQRIPFLLLLGLCCGTLLSFAYINPYSNKLTLTELVLQLSGSRGNLQLGLSLSELLTFSMKFVPCFLFELYMGANLYRHFCTASVYIFSRNPNRVLWYLRECSVILAFSFIYQTVLVISSYAVACYRYEVVWNYSGFVWMLIHITLYGLWLFSMTLLVNIVSLFLGNEISFTVILGGQAAMISLLAFLKIFEYNYELFSIAVNMNPISHLVVGWQSCNIERLNNAFLPNEIAIPLWFSFLYIFLISLIILIIGGIIIQKRDVITTDSEFGGI